MATVMKQTVLQLPDIPNQDDPELTWENVGIAITFILVDGAPPSTQSLTKSYFQLH
jgi:hypothetical protein